MKQENSEMNPNGYSTPVRKVMTRTASFAIVLFAMAIFSSIAHAATFHVTTTSDSNNNSSPTVGSLRKAIIDANNNPGTDTIDFNIPGNGVHTFGPITPLPAITDPVVIDGYTQPGASHNTLVNGDNAVLLIELTGINSPGSEGLAITAGSSTVSGLIFNGFEINGSQLPSAIRLVNKGGNVISGNFIGTNSSGTDKIHNYTGLFVNNSANNILGGSNPAARNLISGNDFGVVLQNAGTINNLVVGNFIGTDRNGTKAVGNGQGVLINGVGQASSGNAIGGTSPGNGNLISGNSDGVVLVGAVSGALIQGNLIGTDVTGKVGLGNSSNGVSMQTSGNSNVIGGLTATARNIISANGGAIAVYGGDSTSILANYIGTDITGTVALGNKLGVYLASSFNSIGGGGATDGNVISANGGYGIEIVGSSKGNFVNRNLIGVAADGATALGNTGPGVIVYDGSNNIIGGSAAGSNTIAFNAGPGVRVDKGNNNQITYNLISSNQGLGIDLDQQGVTLNDSGDADAGPNDLQNFPVLTMASHLSNGLTTVDGTLNSTANTQFSINYYANTVADPTGFGEGQASLGTVSVKTDANGNGNFTGTFVGLSVGQCVSATAMDPAGNTSEFSQCLTITPNAAGSLQFTSAAYSVNESAGKATVTLSRSGGNFGTVSVQYATVAGGTATAGSDYTTVSGTVIWGHGDSADKSFTIPIIDDAAAESNETVNLALSNASNGTQPGSPITAVLTINDNDSHPAGAISFSASAYNVNESGGQATITVSRTGGSTGAVSVQYATANGTAATGSDYSAGSGTLNWADGDAASKTFTIAIVNDSLDEADETLSVGLSNPTGGATLGSQTSATLTIADDDPAPKVSIGDASIAEGNSGTSALTFTISLDVASGQQVSVNYTTADNSAQAGSDYQAANDIVTFAPGETSKQITVSVNGDTQVEPNETFAVNLYNLNNASVGKVTGLGTIVNDDSNSSSPTIQFSQATYSVQEDLGAITVTVTRSGDTSAAASVDYTTTDGSAAQKTDFEYAAGSLTFAPGETSKTITVLINEDMYNESSETFGVTLKNPSGAAIGAQGLAMVTITDDLPESISNPIDDAQTFVYMHYHDFLNREPDAAGLAFWTSQITACGSDAACIDAARANVSAAFYQSIEFQQTAYLLYLMQKESFGTMPKYATFMRDLQEVSRGVVVNAPGWQQKLADNQQKFAQAWTSRSEFKAAYDALANDAYVNALYANAGLVPPQAKKDSLVAALNTASMDRAGVLLDVASDATFRQQQMNAAFVLTEYFGYLRRDPDASPDSDLSGYNFWLTKLNQFGGNYVNAEMVRSFIVSAEYRQRFGQ